VHKGKVPGWLVSTKGIKANPDKIKALANMEEPKSIRDMQKLTGRIAALNRFIHRSANRSLSFFKVLHNANKFDWRQEQREAFNSLRDYLTKMTKMTAPDPKDTLLLYILASHSAVSATLVLERETEGSLRHVPVYFFFISEALSGSKIFYSELEKSHMLSSCPSGNFITTSKITKLWWSPINHYMVSSATEKFRAESANGP
jgi:hypothetical protein